ncbi:hypothetical protein [Vibrio palustris]|uniref:HEPN AbiU2-like domain-containing protein n=1 Tax=Vibrio palustris TaxID=1918946 RepID=A0A1R4B5A4_9VIBR|nr:hypothetical protein [Vibrio palustris]SJL84095.1 hypothetical protein VPAL9027_02076 [Vibrio palustris]
MRSEQVAKFQKQVDSAVIGYLSLLERKELLAVSIEQYQSLSSLEPEVRGGILAIQDTLYASLMVELHAWLFDKSPNSSNLSLYGLLEKLADDKTNLKHLKRYYVAPPKTIDIGETDKSWHQSFKTDREAKFDAHFQDCIFLIKGLLVSEEAKKIAPLRDKALAHKDGRYDIKANNHTVGDVFYLINNMKLILLNLIGLMTRTKYPVYEAETKAKLMAQKFWEHVARTK